MPEEVLALLIITILSVTVLSIVGMTLRYKSRKGQQSVSSGSSSLTTSELERMMKRAVRDATAPLEEKLDQLEDALVLSQSPRQIEKPKQDLLADMDSHNTEDEHEKERVRSRS
jgi:hypothetical protein